jgi:hypothetical protein
MNLPTLYQNVLLGLETEVGKKAFLWAADTWDKSATKYPAEEYAQEAERLASFGAIIHANGSRIAADYPSAHWDGETLNSLMNFILKRHAVHCTGRNISMWWER